MCSLGMEFYNPNISAEMAQILKDYQQSYVPISNMEEKKIVLSKVPVHGDQLFEERARNVQWTFRDGENGYDRLEGLLPEHADWHAKVTLYETEFKIFVKESVAEIGTSRASMNRCGKNNAAKGVHNHHNQYKDFHSREIEGHICASFMEMCVMKKLEDVPTCDMPDPESDNQLRTEWLLSLCKNHVEKYIVKSEFTSLAEQTGDWISVSKSNLPVAKMDVTILIHYILEE
ncbi:uncharacterized protein LOC116292658 isoform X2 [Actinia tenebrosa]|uniref:Uncharacterized protein LOC116292658 isoform X2 n=1 Tax=Actinia tenebrosa TaxID=6105 RepID=A0A6P8HHI8_ACTTE|nr:uncharacterized protein LOC116292658 isoform X2 [Actinia tenebrosa]